MHAVTPEVGGRWAPRLSIGLALAGGLAFLPVFFWAGEIWLGGVLGGAAAGLLTIPICLVLGVLATRRPTWRASAPERPGAASVLLACGVVALGALVWAHTAWDALLLAGVVMPISVWAWIWGAFGWARARALTLPVLFAWFALPWEQFAHQAADLPLQIWSADIAYQLLHLLGYGVRYWDEFTIFTDRYYLVVNETCSGMNMLVSLAMYTIIFAWVAQPSRWARVALVALSVPVAMLANGVRVAAIYLMGHYGGNELAQGFWHTGSAYLIFLPVFWFLYVVNGVLARRWRARRGAHAGRATSPPPAAGPRPPSTSLPSG